MSNIPNSETSPTYVPVPYSMPMRPSLFSGCLGGFFGLIFSIFGFLGICIILIALCTVFTEISFESDLERRVISGPQDDSLGLHGQRVAVIEVGGAIMDTDDFINEQIEDVMKSQDVKAIVLRMDTPGGSVSASDYYYHKLTKLRKDENIPIVVSMGGVCASGGYYIAMSCGTDHEDVIFAEPTSWTGSIGVIVSSYDFSGLAEKIGVKEDSIKSHELKGMGSLTRPFTEKEREILQTLVDDAFGRFREVVYSGRKKFANDHEALTPLATGQVFTTKDALALGLVDREGYLEDAVERAIELAGLDKSTTQVYCYDKTPSLSDLLTASQAKVDETPESVLRRMAVPRAYYMWSIGK